MKSLAHVQTIGRALSIKAEPHGEISPKRQPRWLSDVVATVIHAVRGTTKVLADALPASEAAVYRVADINDADPLKAWWIPTICKETGSFAILDAIEREVGRVAFVLPTAVHAGHADVIAHTATVVHEFGEALARVSQSLADGTITDAERQSIDREIGDVHATLASLQALIAQKVAAA